MSIRGSSFWFEDVKRFDADIPILDRNGRISGQIRMSVMAKSEKQARSIIRKEMIKIARQSTNRAKVVDVDTEPDIPVSGAV